MRIMRKPRLRRSPLYTKGLRFPEAEVGVMNNPPSGVPWLRMGEEGSAMVLKERLQKMTRGVPVKLTARQRYRRFRKAWDTHATEGHPMYSLCLFTAMRYLNGSNLPLEAIIVFSLNAKRTINPFYPDALCFIQLMNSYAILGKTTSCEKVFSKLISMDILDSKSAISQGITMRLKALQTRLDMDLKSWREETLLGSGDFRKEVGVERRLRQIAGREMVSIVFKENHGGKVSAKEMIRALLLCSSFEEISRVVAKDRWQMEDRSFKNAYLHITDRIGRYDKSSELYGFLKAEIRRDSSLSPARKVRANAYLEHALFNAKCARGDIPGAERIMARPNFRSNDATLATYLRCLERAVKMGAPAKMVIDKAERAFSSHTTTNTGVKKMHIALFRIFALSGDTDRAEAFLDTLESVGVKTAHNPTVLLYLRRMYGRLHAAGIPTVSLSQLDAKIAPLLESKKVQRVRFPPIAKSKLTPSEWVAELRRKGERYVPKVHVTDEGAVVEKGVTLKQIERAMWQSAKEGNIVVAEQIIEQVGEKVPPRLLLLLAMSYRKKGLVEKILKIHKKLRRTQHSTASCLALLHAMLVSVSKEQHLFRLWKLGLSNGVAESYEMHIKEVMTKNIEIIATEVRPLFQKVPYKVALQLLFFQKNIEEAKNVFRYLFSTKKAMSLRCYSVSKLILFCGINAGDSVEENIDFAETVFLEYVGVLQRTETPKDVASIALIRPTEIDLQRLCLSLIDVYARVGNYLGAEMLARKLSGAGIGDKVARKLMRVYVEAARCGNAVEVYDKAEALMRQHLAGASVGTVDHILVSSPLWVLAYSKDLPRCEALFRTLDCPTRTLYLAPLYHCLREAEGRKERAEEVREALFRSFSQWVRTPLRKAERMEGVCLQ